MLENLGIQNRALSIEDAAKYLTDKLNESVFASDLISLAQQKKLKLSCYINGVSGRTIVQHHTPQTEEHLEESLPVFRSTLSFTPLRMNTRKVVKNLKGDLLGCDPILQPEKHDRDKGVAYIAKKGASSGRKPYFTDFKNPVWLEGVYEILITKSFDEWLRSALASAPLFDLDDFTLLSSRRELIKIAGYSNDGRTSFTTKPHKAFVRVDTSDLRIQFLHIQEFLDKLSQAGSSDTKAKQKASISVEREVVARVLVKKKATEYLRALSTVQLWNELHSTAIDINEPSIVPDKLFSQRLAINSILKILKQFRDSGIDIPLRR